MIGYPNIDSNKREYIQIHAKNSKETWNKINQIINNKKSGPDNIYLSENGIITDPKQLANQFNNYFVTVPEKITKKKLVKQITNIKTILKTQMNTVCTLLK